MTTDRDNASEEALMQRKGKPQRFWWLYEAALVIRMAAQSVWRRVFRRSGKTDIGG